MFGTVSRDYRTTRHVKTEGIEENNSSDDGYCYGVRLNDTTEHVRAVKGPYIIANANDTPVRLLVDSGSSVNILDVLLQKDWSAQAK